MKALLYLILLSPALFLCGCVEPKVYEEESEYSELPQTRPAEWEYQRSLPGLSPAQY